MTTKRLKTDATNRSLRTLLQGVGFAVLAAIVMVLYPIVTSAKSWGDLHWSLLGFSLTQAVVTAVLAYFMRAVLDPSGIPTPLPPADPGEPDDDKGEVGAVNLVTLLVVVLVVVLLLVLFGVLR